MSLPAEALFPRDWRVVVQITDAEAVDVSALDIEFKILRSLKPSPNRAVVTLWNVSPEHRAQLLKRAKPQASGGAGRPVYVRVEAGYKGRTSVLLSADMREVASQRMGTDWRTIVSMDDGGEAVRAARFPDGGMQFTAGTPLGQVLRQCAVALGLGLGNVASFETDAQIFGWGTTVPRTFTVRGSAFDGLRRVVDSIGATVSIQGGVLQLLPKGKPFAQTAILLSPDTGLLDSPEAAIDSTVSLGFAKTATGKPTTPSPPTPKNTAILKAKAMLIPGLVPGRVVRLESDLYNGNYEITEVEYVGQSFGKDWMAVMVLRNYLT